MNDVALFECCAICTLDFMHHGTRHLQKYHKPGLSLNMHWNSNIFEARFYGQSLSRIKHGDFNRWKWSQIKFKFVKFEFVRWVRLSALSVLDLTLWVGNTVKNYDNIFPLHYKKNTVKMMIPKDGKLCLLTINYAFLFYLLKRGISNGIWCLLIVKKV